MVFLITAKNLSILKRHLQKTEWFLDEYNLLKGSSWLNKYIKEIES